MLISSVTLVGAIPFCLGFSIFVVLAFATGFTSFDFFANVVVLVVVVLDATVRSDNVLTSVFLSVTLCTLPVALLAVVRVTVVVRLAASLFAFSFFSFSTSALFVTVLVAGTRGLGAALVMVRGLDAATGAFGDERVFVAVVFVVVVVAFNLLLLAVLVVVVLLLKGTLGLAGAAGLGGAVVVVVFDCNVVRGAVVGLGAVVVGAFGAGAVVGRLIVFVAGASFEAFLVIVLGTGLALATGAFVSVGLEVVVAVFGLVIGLVAEEVFGTGDLVGPVLGGALVKDAALTEGVALGDDTEDLDVGFTSPTLGDAEIDFLGSALPIGFFLSFSVGFDCLEDTSAVDETTSLLMGGTIVSTSFATSISGTVATTGSDAETVIGSGSACSMIVDETTGSDSDCKITGSASNCADTGSDCTGSVGSSPDCTGTDSSSDCTSGVGDKTGSDTGSTESGSATTGSGSN